MLPVTGNKPSKTLLVFGIFPESEHRPQFPRIAADFFIAHPAIIFLGVITGIGGGILRDIMAGETPYVLKKHIYACASIAGACLYTFFLEYTRSDLAMVVSALLVIAIRMLASHYRWDLPKIKTDGE